MTERCEVCGYREGDCICPECPTCGQAGNKACYEHGHLKASFNQIVGHQQAKIERLEDVLDAERLYLKYIKAHPEEYEMGL